MMDKDVDIVAIAGSIALRFNVKVSMSCSTTLSFIIFITKHNELPLFIPNAKVIVELMGI